MKYFPTPNSFGGGAGAKQETKLYRWISVIDFIKDLQYIFHDS